ncbi:effector-associated domain EAD1-containing protein [Achromobacter dolens]|uniref:effector-associated domain EAD1-containing protein n=1 Tax=Achromobacter dolens TaxID=1287738 RepID=UPI0035566F55
MNFAIALSQGGKKSAVANSSIGLSVPPQDPWAALESALIEVYPFGPRDQEIWSRAGGDLSRLEFHSTGQAAWHSALRKLKQGGGGRSITFAALLKTALEDFSNHPILAAIQAP